MKSYSEIKRIPVSMLCGFGRRSAEVRICEMPVTEKTVSQDLAAETSAASHTFRESRFSRVAIEWIGADLFRSLPAACLTWEKRDSLFGTCRLSSGELGPSFGRGSGKPPRVRACGSFRLSGVRKQLGRRDYALMCKIASNHGLTHLLLDQTRNDTSQRLPLASRHRAGFLRPARTVSGMPLSAFFITARSEAKHRARYRCPKHKTTFSAGCARVGKAVVTERPRRDRRPQQGI